MSGRRRAAKSGRKWKYLPPEPQEYPLSVWTETSLMLALRPDLLEGRDWKGLGSDKKRDPDALDRELPLHLLSLDEYWIGKYPLTNLQYRAFVQAVKHSFPGHWKGGAIPRAVSSPTSTTTSGAASRSASAAAPATAASRNRKSSNSNWRN